MNRNLNSQVSFGWNSFVYHSHSFLTEKTANNITQNGLDKNNILTDENKILLRTFSEKPDRDEIGYLQDDHFSDHKTGRTYFFRKDGAIEHFVRHGLNAVKAFNQHKQRKGIKETGRACHFLEDICQPHHTTTTTFLEALKLRKEHLDFEYYAGKNQDSFEYTIPEKLDLKEKMPLKEFLYALAFSVARQSAPYRQEIDSKEPESWHNTSQKMMNLAQQVSTLFIARILQETETVNASKGMQFKIEDPKQRIYSEKTLHKIEKKVQKAQNYADRNFSPDGVIISDIDETILDNSEYYQNHKHFSEESWAEWVKQASAKPVKPTVEFLKWAKERGYKIFLLTGRKAHLSEATNDNLQKLGIYYDRLYLKPDDYNSPSAKDYKIASRKLIQDEGFNIVVNIGDQNSDLEGGYGKKFKLPNPVYFIP